MAFGARFFRVIAQEKAPYLITILFASIGWGVTYTVGRIVDSPTIEYVTQSADGRYQVDLRNVTRKQIFPSLKVSIHLNGNQAIITKSNMSADPPGWPGREPVQQGEHNTVDYTITSLQPGWIVHLWVEYTGKAQPSFHLVDSQGAIRLVPRSMETLVVEHELALLLTVMVLYAMVIVAVVARFSADPAPPVEPYLGFE
jgi:hypothetical protein